MGLFYYKQPAPSAIRKEPALPAVGSRVRRNAKDWKWGNQDGGGEGVVESVDAAGGGWVEVRWEVTGVADKYRFGAEGCHDVSVAGYDARLAKGEVVVRGFDDAEFSIDNKSRQNVMDAAQQDLADALRVESDRVFLECLKLVPDAGLSIAFRVVDSRADRAAEVAARGKQLIDRRRLALPRVRRAIALNSSHPPRTPSASTRSPSNPGAGCVWELCWMDVADTAREARSPSPDYAFRRAGGGGGGGVEGSQVLIDIRIGRRKTVGLALSGDLRRLSVGSIRQAVGAHCATEFGSQPTGIEHEGALLPDDWSAHEARIADGSSLRVVPLAPACTCQPLAVSENSPVFDTPPSPFPPAGVRAVVSRGDNECNKRTEVAQTTTPTDHHRASSCLSPFLRTSPNDDDSSAGHPLPRRCSSPPRRPLATAPLDPVSPFAGPHSERPIPEGPGEAAGSCPGGVVAGFPLHPAFPRRSSHAGSSHSIPGPSLADAGCFYGGRSESIFRNLSVPAQGVSHVGSSHSIPGPSLADAGCFHAGGSESVLRNPSVPLRDVSHANSSYSFPGPAPAETGHFHARHLGGSESVPPRCISHAGSPYSIPGPAPGHFHARHPGGSESVPSRCISHVGSPYSIPGPPPGETGQFPAPDSWRSPPSLPQHDLPKQVSPRRGGGTPATDRASAAADRGAPSPKLSPLAPSRGQASEPGPAPGARPCPRVVERPVSLSSLAPCPVVVVTPRRASEHAARAGALRGRGPPACGGASARQTGAEGASQTSAFAPQFGAGVSQTGAPAPQFGTGVSQTGASALQCGAGVSQTGAFAPQTGAADGPPADGRPVAAPALLRQAACQAELAADVPAVPAASRGAAAEKSPSVPARPGPKVGPTGLAAASSSENARAGTPPPKTMSPYVQAALSQQHSGFLRYASSDRLRTLCC
ncbi:hypothetical protein DIPPA_08369 [Diplonema papillatum]|nr:hypothetical protein DIPPA_08369 [Diplonema papillatum]